MNRRVLHQCRFVDERYGHCNNLEIREGKIARIGIEDFSAPPVTGEEHMDLDGSFVLPGFIDTHTHFIHTGLHLDMVSLIDSHSIAELLERLKAGNSASEWLRGYGYDESIFRTPEYPLKSDLDRIAPGRPAVIFRRDYHSCVVNSCALEMTGIPDEIRSRETEEGLFRGRANDWIRQHLFAFIDTTERKSALMKASGLAVSRGITTVHALEGGSLFGMDDLSFLLESGDKAPLRIVIYPQITDIQWVLEHHLPRIGGCLLVDGSFGSWTASLTAPYSDREDTCGVLYFCDDSLCSFLENAHCHGLQLSFHAIGDRAITQLVSAYERVLAKHPSSDHRHRIEHCELPGSSDIERISALQLCTAVQPTFEYLWGGVGKMYYQRLGSRRSAMTNPFRKFLDRGVLVAGGSDSDVTPMDPLLGIYSAVMHPNEGFRVSPREALDMFTRNGARIGFLENETGEIREGMWADLVVLSRNPLEAKPESIKDIEVKMTFVKGEPVFDATHTVNPPSEYRQRGENNA